MFCVCKELSPDAMHLSYTVCKLRPIIQVGTSQLQSFVHMYTKRANRNDTVLVFTRNWHA